MSQRPEALPLFTALFIIGLQIALSLPGGWAWAFLALSFGLCLLELSMGLTERGRFGWVPLATAAVAAGIFAGGMRIEPHVPPAAAASFDGTAGLVKGTFAGECRWHKNGSLSLNLEDATLDAASQTIALPGRIALVIDSCNYTPEPGQRYQATGTLQVGVSRRPRFTARELAPTAFPETLGPIIGRIQRGIRDGTARLLSQRHQSLMAGFIIGDTSLLSFADRRLFRETGVTHLLAVSGQHVMVLGLLLAAIWSWCGVPPLSRGLLTIAVLGLFGLIAAGQPSVWRAVVMYAAGVAIWNLEADPGPLRPVALSAWVLLLWNPAWFHHIGFQLSFMAVLGIILGRAPIERPLVQLGLPLLLARYLAVSFAANLATIPLVIHHFGFVSLAAFIVNPLIVWTFGIILPMGIFLAICGHLWLTGGLVLAAALSLILDALLTVIELGGRLPGAVLAVPQIPGPVVALIYAGLLWLIIRFQPEATAVGAEISDGREGRRHGSAQPGWRPAPAFRGSGRSGGTEENHQSETATTPIPPSPDTAGESLRQQAVQQAAAHDLRLSLINPLLETAMIEAIDGRLSVFPRRSLKSRGNLEVTTFPVRELTVDAQTFYHRLDDLTRETLETDPDRLLQAQVFLLAIFGTELLQRVPMRLEPPADPADLKLPMAVKNRPLALALAADAFFRSSLPARTNDPVLSRLIATGQQVHLEARHLLARFVRERPTSGVAPHLEQRKALFAWLRELLAACPR